MSVPALVEPGPPLTPDRAARFARHLTLPGVGEIGQRRLARARVLVIGAGGLGAPTIQYLAAGGVGSLTLIDDDVVERSNLQRQVLHSEGDVGRAKAESARDAVGARDAQIAVNALVERLSPDNALALFDQHDLVIDGSDNFATRYLVSDAAELTGTPVVWGSIHQFAGQVSVFWPGRGPMLRDVFPDVPDEDSIESCAVGGVFGVLCGAVGSAMAVEALKLICGIGEPLLGRLARYDALTARWSELRFTTDPHRPPVRDLSEIAPLCRTSATVHANAISAAEVAARLASGGDSGLVVVDVRSAQERSADVIAGSFHVPLGRVLDGGWNAVREALGSSAEDGRDVVITCQAGARSARAISALAASAPAGVALRNLTGGMDAYRPFLFE